jgi:formylglycine-generating enzyme required for sulfatase activity
VLRKQEAERLEGRGVLAAGGEKPEERYAWDIEQAMTSPEEIPQRANSNGNGIERSNPVWMYPVGASPRRVMEMSGNAWEWQANYRNQHLEWVAVRRGKIGWLTARLDWITQAQPNI